MTGLAVGLALACPLAFHVAVVRGNGPLLALLSAVLAAPLVRWGAHGRMPWPWLAALGAGVLAAAALDRELPTRLPFLLPIGVYALVCWTFARTLVDGREPLVTRIARLARDGELPEPLVAYTRRVTRLWALTLAGMAVVSAALARFAEAATWSLFTNVLGYALLVALFLLEYVYRLVRYPGIRHDTPWRVATTMAAHAHRLFR
jgi:uncharacterized membrane protein